MIGTVCVCVINDVFSNVRPDLAASRMCALTLLSTTYHAGCVTDSLESQRDVGRDVGTERNDHNHCAFFYPITQRVHGISLSGNRFAPSGRGFMRRWSGVVTVIALIIARDPARSAVPPACLYRLPWLALRLHGGGDVAIDFGALLAAEKRQALDMRAAQPLSGRDSAGQNVTGGHEEEICAMCRLPKPRAAFSAPQWKRGSGKRRCEDCAPAVRRRGAEVRACSACIRLKARSSSSKTQGARGNAKLQCQRCAKKGVRGSTEPEKIGAHAARRSRAASNVSESAATVRVKRLRKLIRLERCLPDPCTGQGAMRCWQNWQKRPTEDTRPLGLCVCVYICAERACVLNPQP